MSSARKSRRRALMGKALGFRRRGAALVTILCAVVGGPCAGRQLWGRLGG